MFFLLNFGIVNQVFKIVFANMNTKKEYFVRNYMRKDVVTLNEDALFIDVVRLMIKQKTNGVVVVDEKRHVLGIISNFDIIEHMVPDSLEEDCKLEYFTASDSFSDELERVKNNSIKDFMTKQVYTIHQDDSLMQVATLLSEFKICQLPVVDENGIMVGYINRTDIKNAMGDVFNIR